MAYRSYDDVAFGDLRDVGGFDDELLEEWDIGAIFGADIHRL